MPTFYLIVSFMLLFVVSPCSFHLRCAFVLLSACASETDMLRKEAFSGAAGGQYGYINETPDSEQVDFSVMHTRMRSAYSQECSWESVYEFVIEKEGIVLLLSF